jgi:hypothetical protein
MSDPRIDIPPTGSPNFDEKIREALSTYLGKRGDKLDRGVTVRDLVDAGIVTLSDTYLKYGGSPISGIGAGIGAGTGTTGPAGPVGPQGPAGGTYTPDLTPPPTPSGTSVTAGLGYIFLTTDDPTFTQGHGYARTLVYGVRNPVGLPIFSDAQLVHSFIGPVGSFPTDLGTTWRIWMKWESVDDVLSVNPSGLPNGQVATTGKIGNADLNPLIITANNIANGAVTPAAFQSGTNPVFFSASLPVLPSATYPAGTLLIRTGDSKLFRSNGTAWISTVDGSDIAANSIVAGQVAVGGLAAGAITVGTAAIANGAIVNAMIGDATISSAKVNDLSVTKLTGAALRVGAFIQSTNFTSGPTGTGWRINADGTAEMQAAFIRGQLVASQIDSKGLTIRDTAGNAILTAGASVGASTFGGNVTGSVAGVAASSVVADVSSALSALPGKLSATGAAVLTGPVTLNTAAAILVGTTNDGLYLGNTGLVGRKASATTFAIDAAGNAFFQGAIGSGTSITAPTLTGGTINGTTVTAATINGTTITGGTINGTTGTFDGVLNAATVNAVNTVNIAGNAVSATNSASGTANTVSTTLVVPSGQTMRITAIGLFDSKGGGAAGTVASPVANYALTINGVTVTASAYATQYYVGTASNGNYFTGVGPASVGNIVNVAGPATVTISITGSGLLATNDVDKTVIAFGFLR